MIIVITVVHVLVSIGLILVVLLQTGKGAEVDFRFRNASKVHFEAHAIDESTLENLRGHRLPLRRPGTPIASTDQIGVCNLFRNVPISDIRDGTSNVIAVSEAIVGDGNSSVFTLGDVIRGVNMPAGFPNTFATQAQLNTYSSLCLASGSPPTHYGITGKNWINGMPGQSFLNTLNPPNSPNVDCMECGGCAWYDARGVINARSRHTGGVHALMADGATRFITNSIDVTTWQRLGAIADRQPLGQF